MSQITTHILDTSIGKPASGVSISLWQKQDADWMLLAQGQTDDDGRIGNLLPSDKVLTQGTYKMHFETASYHRSTGQQVFYPEVEIQFNLMDSEHYHIPLLLNPYGYSTYRGS